MPHKDPEARRAYARAWDRAYAAAHPEIIKKRASIKHARHRARHNTKARADYQLNLEKNRRIAREYYHAHKAERQAAHKAWRETHQDHLKTYRLEHIEEGRVAKQRRRALKIHAPINDLTAAQWKEIKEHYGHRCVYCRRKMARLTMDHIIPLSKGGSHTASNIVPACKSCNSRKHTGPPLKPVQPLMFTIAPTKKTKKAVDTLVNSSGLRGADDADL